MKDDTRIALNFGLMGVAANALFVCGLLRNDFLMGDEADPAYKHYHTHIQRVEYLKTQELKKGGVPAADRDGVSTGFVLSGTDELWEYYNNLSIGATGWYALAQMKVNPLKS